MYILVSPFLTSFDEYWLTYFVWESFLKDIKEWQIVEVPFKDDIILWIVLKIFDKKNINSFKSSTIEEGIKSVDLKPVVSIFDENIFLNNKQIELVLFISKYYFTFIHNSLNLFFPKNLLEKIQKRKLKFLEKNKFDYIYNNEIILSEKQNEIFNDIITSDFKKFLLYWITWSWKTEIYINLINYYIKQDKQVLLLIPEIILNNQIYSRLEKVFWENILIINSSVSDAKKTNNWLNIYNNNAKIIIGTRSALFYPYNNLWLIIVDEEHDNSYISDSSPRYNSVDIVNKISEINNIKIIFSSWTPSIISMYKWLKWDYKILNLTQKYK